MRPTRRCSQTSASPNDFYRRCSVPRATCVRTGDLARAESGLCGLLYGRGAIRAALLQRPRDCRCGDLLWQFPAGREGIRRLVSGRRIYGGLDPRMNPGVPGFADAMKAAGRSFEFRIYDGAQHAFFNDTRPSYDVRVARDSFARLLDFLRRTAGSYATAHGCGHTACGERRRARHRPGGPVCRHRGRHCLSDPAHRRSARRSLTAVHRTDPGGEPHCEGLFEPVAGLLSEVLGGRRLLLSVWWSRWPSWRCTWPAS